MSVFLEDNENYSKIELKVPESRFVLFDKILPDYTYIYEVISATKSSILYDGTDYSIDRNLKSISTEIKFSAGLEGADIKIFYENPKTNGCFHQYKKYVGFTDIFSYCVKCDQKKES